MSGNFYTRVCIYIYTYFDRRTHHKSWTFIRVTRARAHTYAHTHSLSLAFTHAHTHTFSPSFSLSYTHILTHSLAHTQTHTHTHTQTHTHLPAHTHRDAWTRQGGQSYSLVSSFGWRMVILTVFGAGVLKITTYSIASNARD